MAKQNELDYHTFRISNGDGNRGDVNSGGGEMNQPAVTSPDKCPNPSWHEVFIDYCPSCSWTIGSDATRNNDVEDQATDAVLKAWDALRVAETSALHDTRSIALVAVREVMTVVKKSMT